MEIFTVEFTPSGDRAQTVILEHCSTKPLAQGFLDTYIELLSKVNGLPFKKRDENDEVFLTGLGLFYIKTIPVKTPGKPTRRKRGLTLDDH